MLQQGHVLGPGSHVAGVKVTRVTLVMCWVTRVTVVTGSRGESCLMVRRSVEMMKGAANTAHSDTWTRDV